MRHGEFLAFTYLPDADSMGLYFLRIAGVRAATNTPSFSSNQLTQWGHQEASCSTQPDRNTSTVSEHSDTVRYP